MSVRSATELEYPHPLIGHVVTVRRGAKPAGWDPDEEFGEDPPVYATVKDVATAEDGYPFGTLEAGGQWWDFKDVQFG